MRPFALVLALLATASPVPSPAAGGASLPLTLVADVPLPGRATRMDYQAVDSTHRRLYIAHLGDSALVVFDLEGQRPIREIAGLPSVHGVAIAPEEHLIFATATAAQTLAILDDQTFEVRARVPAGEYPNGLAYDPAAGRVLVSNNKGVGIGVVDVKSSRALPGIDVGGGAGNTQYDAESGHVLAAVHGKPYLAEIDARTARVVARIPLTGVSSCHGLFVAASPRLAFAVCHGRGPTLAVIDLAHSHRTQALSLPPDVDVLAFDPGLGRLYAAAESGTVAVFTVAADHAVTELGRGFVGPNAHTVAVDPVSHRVYFPIADLGGRPVLRIMEPRAAAQAP